MAWYGENAGGMTHAVATKLPNELGLYDMSGNVWEWCQDAYEGYRARPVTDPLVAGDAVSRRVYRGGAWFSRAKFCRVACRNSYAPGLRRHSIGLRLAL